jgi:hypothetical protein
MASDPQPEEQEQPYVDPHHRVPDDQWGDIVRAAKAFREASDESETD